MQETPPDSKPTTTESVPRQMADSSPRVAANVGVQHGGPDTIFGRTSRLLLERLPAVGFVVFFLILIVIFSAIKFEQFFQWQTAATILNTSDVILILAVGLVFVLTVREFDISVVAGAGLAGSVSVVLMHDYHTSTAVAVIAALIVGVLVGALNGAIIALLGANNLITTLATTSLFMGIQEWITNNRSVTTGINPSYFRLTTRSFGTINVIVLFAVLLVAVASLFMKKTVFGRQSYATGANAEAAHFAGVRTKWVRFWSFVLLGLFIGVAGIVISSQGGGSPDSSISGQYLLPGYAAAFLGAITLGRGRFTAWSAAWGVLFVSTLQVGLLIVQAPVWTSDALTGAVLLGAVFISRTRPSGSLSVM